MAHQLVITVEDSKVLATIKKMLSLIPSVSSATPDKGKTAKTKTGLEQAQEEIESGDVFTYRSSDELFEKLGI